MADLPTVVVTGAAGGIGREVCRAFAADGGRVIGLDVDRAGLASLGVGIEGVALDVTDPAAVAHIFGKLGPIDVLIHAAGITALGPFMDTPLEAFERVLDVNVSGAVIVTAAALPGLIARGGRIGVLSSVAGFSPLLYRTAYAASKHALHGFFESLRAELADSGVSITMICPSFVDTGIERRAAHRAAGAPGSWTTTGRVMTPEHLAGLVRKGVMRRRRLVLPSSTARSAYVLSRVGPALFERFMRKRIGRPS
ncbi:MAG: SDR family NAD(P)-dependent oxidoreductase [Acidimicrobiia bacterium]|nr:SDR family NAD(P)-dependent oxidoreductase [Acidimicrobiia bacterium]